MNYFQLDQMLDGFPSLSFFCALPTVAFWIAASGWLLARQQHGAGRRLIVFGCKWTSNSLWMLVCAGALWRLAEHAGCDLEFPAVDLSQATAQVFSLPGVPSNGAWLVLFLGTIALAPWVIYRVRSRPCDALVES